MRAAALLAVLLLAFPAFALIMVGRGNDPVRDPGWPEGALAVANLKARIGWWEGPPFGGGQWQFVYRGDTETFQQALDAFAAIRAPALELVIHEGPEENALLKDSAKPDASTRVDWAFTVWVPENWHRLYNNPKSVFLANTPNFREPVAAPRLEVYLGGGQVEWAKVKVPANLRVSDDRAATAGLDPALGSVARVEIYDMANGRPVRGAKVVAKKWADASQGYVAFAEARADDMGRTELTQLPADRVVLVAEAPGYAPRTLDQDRFRPRTLKRIVVELAAAASVQGVLVDTAGKPVAGAKVSVAEVMALNGRGYSPAGTLSTVTGADGRFEFTGLPTGFTQMHATATGYHFTDLFALHEVPATDLVLRMAGAGSIHVAVLDKHGQPMSRFEGNEVLVQLEPKGGSKIGSWGGSATVKADGTHDFSDVPPGEYRVTSQPNPANTDRRYAPEQVIEVKPGARTEVKVRYE
jgi:hypothetical protein